MCLSVKRTNRARVGDTVEAENYWESRIRKPSVYRAKSVFASASRSFGWRVGSGSGLGRIAALFNPE